jgi:predicted transposase/invertase (TIGR01784 family)
MKEEGREEGREERDIEIARKMKSEGAELGFIARITGLSEETIATL